MPYSGGLQAPGSWRSTLITVGVLVDSRGHALGGAPVVITQGKGVAVAEAVTAADGTFSVELPATPALELTVPTDGVYGIQVEAGRPMLIVVR
jgi:hypothetical protein